MYLSIKEVQTTDDFKLILSFENAEKRIFDAKPLLSFGNFTTLKDLNLFKKVRVNFDTIEWENGLDLDPEYLYKKSKKISEETFAQLKRFAN